MPCNFYDFNLQIIDERHQQLVRDIDAQRANLDEEKRQLDEDRRRIGVTGAIVGPPPRCVSVSKGSLFTLAANYIIICIWECSWEWGRGPRGR